MARRPGKIAVGAALFSISMTALPVAPAYAALVPTDNVIASETMPAERERVLEFMGREDVQNELVKQGVDPAEATARVAALSVAQISELAGHIDEMPAGQDAAAAVIGAAVTIFVILLITDLLCLTSVFNFTRCAR
jgi:hypothetical protein